MIHRKNLLCFSMLALGSIALSSCGGGNHGYSIEEVDNAGGSAFYEIFVGSFCDSNGDGVGDLNGVKSKLPYLKKLGVSGVWLTPIHPSNSYHHYDVKDYYSVSPDFGTVDDFVSLCEEAKKNGIDIILDMVFNHTSNQSEWYKNWVANAGKPTSPYYQNYVWSKTPKEGFVREPTIGGYVEANFDSSMPELNMDNDYVRSELKKIQDFWLEKGAAGFRYDAVKYYYCTNQGNNVIVGDTEKNVALMKELAESARAKKPGAYLIGECWVDDPDLLAEYVRSGMNVFNFTTSGTSGSGSVGNINTTRGYRSFGEAVANQSALIRSKNANADFACFISNHDMDRWGDYHKGMPDDDKQRKAMVSSYLLTPGTPYMYYGEEIEMIGTRGATAQTDAMRRQAMVWGDETITCKQPENFVVKGQTETTVEKGLEDGYSMLNHYRKVLSIRNKYKDVFRYGIYTTLNLSTTGFAYGFKIEYEGQNYYLIHNVYSEEVSGTFADAKEILEEIPTSGSPTFSNSNLVIPGFSSVFMR